MSTPIIQDSVGILQRQITALEEKISNLEFRNNSLAGFIAGLTALFVVLGITSALGILPIAEAVLRPSIQSIIDAEAGVIARRHVSENMTAIVNGLFLEYENTHKFAEEANIALIAATKYASSASTSAKEIKQLSDRLKQTLVTNSVGEDGEIHLSIDSLKVSDLVVSNYLFVGDNTNDSKEGVGIRYFPKDRKIKSQVGYGGHKAGGIYNTPLWSLDATLGATPSIKVE